MKWLKELFGTGKTRQTQLDVVVPEIITPAYAEPATKEPFVCVEKNEITGTASMLVAKAGENRYRGTFEKLGVSAIFGTNESNNPDFYESVARDYKPNGYIYGPGCGNIISMVKAFQTAPKGLIMVDIDPDVVQFGKAFVKYLKENETFTGFVGSFSQADPKNLNRLAEMVEDSFSFNFYVKDDSRPDAVLAKRYSMFHQMAKDDNIAVLHADLFDTELMRYVSGLPKFKTSNNLVYISNVADHIVRAVYAEKSEDGMRWCEKPAEFTAHVNKMVGKLQGLDPQSPNKNVFIDTTQKGLHYKLRVGSTPPEYGREIML